MSKSNLVLSRTTRRYQEILHATFLDLEGRVRVEDAWKAIGRNKAPGRLAKARLCIAMRSIGFTTRMVTFNQPNNHCHFVRGDRSRNLGVEIVSGFGATAFVSPDHDAEL